MRIVPHAGCRRTQDPGSDHQLTSRITLAALSLHGIGLLQALIPRQAYVYGVAACVGLTLEGSFNLHPGMCGPLGPSLHRPCSGDGSPANTVGMHDGCISWGRSGHGTQAHLACPLSAHPGSPALAPGPPYTRSALFVYIQWACSIPPLWWLLSQLVATLPPGSTCVTTASIRRCALIELGAAATGLAVAVATDLTPGMPFHIHSLDG